MDAAANGNVDYAVVPLENAIEGSVNITVDYLVHEQPLSIVGEITVPIQQHLLVHPQYAEVWEEVYAVHSHPHAIAQCHKFLNEELKGITARDMTSTSAAAQYVKEHPEEKLLSLQMKQLQKYGLTIVRRSIHTHKNNHTRFLVLHKKKKAILSNNGENRGEKTTLMITLPADYAGALYQVLSAFAWRKLNLSKLNRAR